MEILISAVSQRDRKAGILFRFENKDSFDDMLKMVRREQIRYTVDFENSTIEIYGDKV